MSNLRHISKTIATKTINVGGYIFQSGLYYLVDDRLAETLDQISVTATKVFSSAEQEGSSRPIDLTNKTINEQGKMVNKPTAKKGVTLSLVTKPDTTQSTDAEVNEAIKQLTDYSDLDRAGLETEAKARKLSVRSNMKDSTIVEMLKEHDAEQTDPEEPVEASNTQTDPEDDDIIKV